MHEQNRWRQISKGADRKFILKDKAAEESGEHMTTRKQLIICSGATPIGSAGRAPEEKRKIVQYSSNRQNSIGAYN